MQVLAFDVEAQNQRPHRRRRRASSCCGFAISPHLLIDGLSRNSFSYDRLPQQPLNLTIRKLDGSFFGVEVLKMATVAELKQAVEAAFSHLPRKGPGKISWSHVWGNFCLCYNGWKPLADGEPISNYGINDGDELQFVRHVSIDDDLMRRQSKYGLLSLEEPKISDDLFERELDDEKDDSSCHQEISGHQHDDNRNEDIVPHCESKLTRILGQWFKYQRLGSPGRKSKNSSFSSRLAEGFMGSFRSIVRLCRSNKLNSQKDPLDEV